MVERLDGPHSEPSRNPAPPGSIPIDLGAMQGTSYHSGAHLGSRGNGGHSVNKRTYHYCNQSGHFMLSCLKLKQDIEAKAAGRFLP